MKLFKKNENKKTTKLPMTGKVTKGFRYYCMAVMAMTFVLGTSVTAVSYTHLCPLPKDRFRLCGKPRTGKEKDKNYPVRYRPYQLYR